MSKRTFSIVLALALVAGVFSALPAHAQTTAIPATVNIEDVSGDGNGLNDQGFGGICIQSPVCIPEVSDNSGAGIGAADILKVWFTNTATHVSAHIQTTFPGPNGTPGLGIIYRVIVNDRCTYLQGFVPSRTYQGTQTANVREFCDGTATTPGGEITIEALEDGTGITTLSYPLELHPALKMGATLALPTATASAAHGQDGAALYAPTLDDTPVGTDYTISSGGPVVAPAPEEPKEEPPGKSDPPGKGKKKGCKKGKGKKKGACPEKPKPPVAPSCPAYVPGEEGAEAETTIVTAAATEEKPVELTLHVPEGIGVGGVAEQLMGHGYANVQVDSADPSVGLFVRLEMPMHADYDLYVNNPDGEMAARAAGFNPEPAVYNDDGAGGHTEQGAEMIDGLATADCQGYTIDAVSASAEGGDLTLKYWLGEPAPTEPGQALSTFFFLLGI